MVYVYVKLTFTHVQLPNYCLLSLTWNMFNETVNMRSVKKVLSKNPVGLSEKSAVSPHKFQAAAIIPVRP